MTGKRKIGAKGFSLVEVVITASIFLVVILGLTGTFAFAVKGSLENVTKVQASFLEEEGLEVARLMRDAGWDENIAVHPSGEPFRILFDGSAWQATFDNALVDGVFERKITFSDVYRDSGQNIVSSGGTLDSNTRKVTVEVSWPTASGTTTRALSTYITNIFSD